jgi:hypothetical protein
MVRRATWILGAIVAVLPLQTQWCFALNGQCTDKVDLNRYERSQFLEVFLSRRASVSAQFLAKPGCAKEVATSLARLGARVDYAGGAVEYVEVTIPRAALLDSLEISGLAFAYVRDDDRLYPTTGSTRSAQSGAQIDPIPNISIPYPRVDDALAVGGPYFAAEEMGLSTLWMGHPQADGRGTRVAILDEGIDLLHPALLLGRDMSGNLVPKVADLNTLTSTQEDGAWVIFDQPITTTKGSFEAAGRTWTVPEDGTYRFGVFKQDLILGQERNSRSKKLSISAGVLWSPDLGRIWVNKDGTGNFKNNRALGDYGLTHDIDWFGAKEGLDDDRIPFGVKINPALNAAYIRIGGGHGALVAGALAGNRITGGLFNGAAPSAQLIDENVTRSTLIPGILAMEARSDVDVINFSGGVGRAEFVGLREGIEDFAQHVIERAIQVYGKPIVAYSAALGTIHVNDYTSPAMLRRNRQLQPPYLESINSFVWNLSSGLVNTVLAPSANLTTESRYEPQDLLWDDGRRHSYSDDSYNPPAPNGYVIGANESPTIPIVSGVLADLISEARREHVPYDAIRLNNAIFTGTRLLEGFPLSKQGYGLINAANSWNQLAKMARADDPTNKNLTSFTISHMEAGRSVEIQGFHADLAKAGEKLQGEIWITRHGGYAGGRKYTLSLRGNDGDYELLDREATLERDKSTRVRFRTNGAPGWKIAFLELRDAKAEVVMQDVPLSVRAPDVPEKTVAGVDKYDSTIEPLRSESRYIRVDADVQAARYLMEIPYTGPQNISTRSFPGGRYQTTKIPPGEPIDAAHHIGPMEELRSLVINDKPGTQEIFWENRGRPEYATQYDGPAPDMPIHAELTVTKYAVEISRNGDTLTFKNKQAAIDGRTELYDATIKKQSLIGTGLHAMGETGRLLPDHLAEWRLRVTSNSPSQGPVDVYVFNCTGKNGCYVAAQQEISAPSQTLAIENPQAGAWKIVVSGRDQVKHSVSYAVHDALLVPAATPIETTDTEHPSETSWTDLLPKQLGGVPYAAFRIAGIPGIEREKNGLRIAMTPLDADAP